MEGWVCGTGASNLPKPGDPDNHINLRATPAFGGIDLEWSFPLINPHAVAHVLINRGYSDDFEQSARLGIAHGSTYYDRITVGESTTLYYWVQVVSVNGTYGEIIGPSSARARPLIDEMMELLTGQIDSGLLAESLRSSVAQIETNKLGLNAEILARAASDDALGASLNVVNAFTEETRAMLQEEVLARTTADEAFVAAVSTLYAELESEGESLTAAIQNESQVRVEATQALARQITTAQTALNGELASVQTRLETKIDSVTGEVNAMYTAKVDANGLIGGFGLTNDGETVEAGFDVDRFWIGRTGDNKRKPFIIEDGEVFIDEAAINSLTFDKLRDVTGNVMVENGKLKAQYLTVGDIQSDNYIQGQRGWILKK